MNKIIHTENYKMVVEQCSDVTIFNISNAGHHSLNILVNFTSFFLNPGSLHIDSTGKGDCWQKSRFGKCAHQLWCYSCHTIRQDMWWCKEPYMATGKIDFTIFFFMKKFKMRAYHSTKINNPNFNQGTEKRPQHLRMEIHHGSRQTQKCVGG